MPLAARQLDVGQQDRPAAVRSVVNGKVWPIVLGDHEKVASFIGIHSLVRGARRGSVVQVRAHPRMLGVGGIDHRDAEVLLQRSNTVRSIVGAVTVVRRSILRKCSFKLTLGLLAHEFQIAVVGALGIAAEALLLRGLALQSAFGVIPGSALGFGHWSHRRRIRLGVGKAWNGNRRQRYYGAYNR